MCAPSRLVRSIASGSTPSIPRRSLEALMQGAGPPVSIASRRSAVCSLAARPPPPPTHHLWPCVLPAVLGGPFAPAQPPAQALSPLASRFFAEVTGQVYLMPQPGHPGSGEPGTRRWQRDQGRSRSYAMPPNEAFSRVEIDGLLEDAAWNLMDGRSVRYEYRLGAALQLRWRFRRFVLFACGKRKVGRRPIIGASSGLHNHRY